MVEKSGNIWKTFLEPINTKAEKRNRKFTRKQMNYQIKIYIYIYILIYVLDFGDLEEKISLFFLTWFFSQ